jgi:hypothetical protein
MSLKDTIDSEKLSVQMEVELVLNEKQPKSEKKSTNQNVNLLDE